MKKIHCLSLVKTYAQTVHIFVVQSLRKDWSSLIYKLSTLNKRNFMFLCYPMRGRFWYHLHWRGFRKSSSCKFIRKIHLCHPAARSKKVGSCGFSALYPFKRDIDTLFCTIIARVLQNRIRNVPTLSMPRYYPLALSFHSAHDRFKSASLQ